MGPSFQAFLLYLAALSWVRHHLVLAMTTEEKAKTRDQILEMFDHAYSSYMHYTAIMKYISQPPLLLSVHMHNPTVSVRGWMDSLLAFFPGLQAFTTEFRVHWGQHPLRPEFAESTYFLYKAFTTEFRVHWGQHPLRPEFAESTYFLYKATGDPYYLQVGRSIVDSLNQHARVPCGFAAVQDVRTGRHEDRMDSFFLAEMFKYLYLLFSEKEQLLFDVDDYIFSTEAHLLPVTLSTMHPACQGNASAVHPTAEEDLFTHSCPSTQTLFPNNPAFAKTIRDRYKYLLGAGGVYHTTPVREFELPLHDTGMEPVEFLKSMGISLSSVDALSGGQPDSQKGVYRLKLIAELTHTPEEEVIEPLAVQIISPPFLGRVVLTAGPAKFGMDLTKNEHGGTDSSSEGTPLFQMVGDGGSTSEISVPLVFLFSKEGQVLLDALEEHSSVEVLLLPRNKQLGQDIKKKDRPLVMNVNVRLADEWDLQAGSSGQLGGGIATAELVLEPEEQGEESQGLGSSSTASDLSTGAQAEPSDSQQPCAQPEP
ncbi:UNVERIFIED_CONTAM: hypothetical protein FKN15_071085 [Acipenser sinensis]